MSPLSLPLRQAASQLLLAGAVASVTLLSLGLPAGACTTPITDGFQDWAYPDDTGDNDEATGEKPESKLWFHDSVWWASLWSNAGNAYHIHRLNLATQCWEDTGTALDPRLETKADVLWDGSQLLVASHVYDGSGEPAPAGERGEVFRYDYDPGTQTWSLEPGFPVEINEVESETLVIDIDSSGQLWATWVENQQVMVNHSLGSDHTQWGSPFVLPVLDADNLTDDDIASIVAYDGRVGVFWSNQNTDTFEFAVHVDGSDDQVWGQTSPHSNSSDDHISLKVLPGDGAGRLAAVVKTDDSDELVLLLVCEATPNFCSHASDWTEYVVFDSDDFEPTRPILQVDAENREVYVLTRVKEGSTEGIHYKKSSLDTISFDPTTPGTPFVRRLGSEVNDPSGTKQLLSSASGLAVLASEDLDLFYFHNHLPIASDGSPQVLGFSPLSGPIGTLVTLTGQNFTSASLVSFGGVPQASFSIDSDSQIRASVPPGAATGPIGVTNSSGSGFSSVDFTVELPSVSLGVMTSGAGGVVLDPPGGLYASGSVVTLTAQPGPGSEFAGWSGDLQGLTNPTTLTMNSNRSVTASFDALPAGFFSLDVSADPEGSVGTSPAGRVFAQGSVVTLTAEPDLYALFDGWSGDLSGVTNPTTLVMNAHKVVNAGFVSAFPVQATSVGDGQVTISPAGLVYPAGSVVTLTATPQPDSFFSGWSGDLAGFANPTTLVVNGAKSVVASFDPPAHGVEPRQTETAVASDTLGITTSADLVGGPDQVYLAAISTKPHVDTVLVSGLGLGWTELAEQCGGRSQTGVSLWAAWGPVASPGAVTASFAEQASEAVLSVTRYAGSDPAGSLGSSTSANSNGVSGACQGGNDSNSYSFPLVTGGLSSQVHAALALRHRTHEASAPEATRPEWPHKTRRRSYPVRFRSMAPSMETSIGRGRPSRSARGSRVRRSPPSYRPGAQSVQRSRSWARASPVPSASSSGACRPRSSPPTPTRSCASWCRPAPAPDASGSAMPVAAASARATSW
jgi:hypothetical protein